ncbi:hypothetical protein EOL18_05105 [Raoultella ornithinolytica]|nr:hypothetical protein EOL18_05105 [Raoultella ornithinolytica]
MEYYVCVLSTIAALYLQGFVLLSQTRLKVAEPEDKIAAANARERHQWRYARWGWNLIQLACCLYFIFSAIRFILS